MHPRDIQHVLPITVANLFASPRLPSNFPIYKLPGFERAWHAAGGNTRESHGSLHAVSLRAGHQAADVFWYVGYSMHTHRTSPTWPAHKNLKPQIPLSHEFRHFFMLPSSLTCGSCERGGTVCRNQHEICAPDGTRREYFEVGERVGFFRSPPKFYPAARRDAMYEVPRARCRQSSHCRGTTYIPVRWIIFAPLISGGRSAPGRRSAGAIALLCGQNNRIHLSS